jgi:hypothetical protein
MILTVNISIPLFKICFTFLLSFQKLMALDFFLCSVAEPYHFYAALAVPVKVFCVVHMFVLNAL